jgi:hypothetical protein
LNGLKKSAAAFILSPMVKYSSGLAMVVFQQANQSLSAAYRAGAAWHGWIGGQKQDHVAIALMISLGVEMLHVLPQCTMQRRFAKQNQLGQTLLFHRPPNVPQKRWYEPSNAPHGNVEGRVSE